MHERHLSPTAKLLGLCASLCSQAKGKGTGLEICAQTTWFDGLEKTDVWEGGSLGRDPAQLGLAMQIGVPSGADFYSPMDAPLHDTTTSTQAFTTLLSVIYAY